MSLLKVEDVVTAYGKIEALKCVSLEVAEGAITCLLGPNGAGKTTLMMTIAGILKPRRGRVLFGGTDIAGQAPHAIVARGVALVPENRLVFPAMTVLENPTLLPDTTLIDRIEEPYVKARIMAPADYIGGIMKLGQERRGVYNGMHYLDTARVEFDFEFPLGEIVLDFYDRLKSISRGYASLDYEMAGYRESDLVKLDMLINGDQIDAFSVIIHRDKAYDWGRKVAEKLKELIPRQLFQVIIQAAIGSKIIARETVSALRKDVLAKCYGGDVTRKRKLLEKQKEGKKRMKQVGTVEIPQEAFLAVLQVE